MFEADYRNPMWQQHVKALAKGDIGAVANAAPWGASAAMIALADGLRLATITARYCVGALNDPIAHEEGCMRS